MIEEIPVEDLNFYKRESIMKKRKYKNEITYEREIISERMIERARNQFLQELEKLDV